MRELDAAARPVSLHAATRYGVFESLREMKIHRARR